MKNKGFTLIELLIVIALLGALAVGLLAALDPFEQLKKGTDTGTRNTVSEIHGAVIRYFAIVNEMPWETAGDADGVITALSADTDYDAIGIDHIISSGELKTQFQDLAGNTLSNITVSGTSETAIVCYRPLSKSFRNDPNTRWTNAGVDNTGSCGDPASETFACHWCVQ